MLKRMSLVFTLLMALVGIIGVQAQAAAEPQSMAQYVPADSEMFFAFRTDGAFLDELSGIVNGVVDKLPPAIAAQAQGLDLKTLLEAQVGPLAETGVGDYVAVSVSNLGVVYDQDRSNDDEVVFYAVLDLTDRAKFEAFFEKAVPNAEKADENGATVYSNAAGARDQGNLTVQDDVAYLTNQAEMPSGDMLSTDSQFSDTLANLPESNYNLIAYIDYGSLFSAMMEQMPAQQMDIFNSMGMNLSDYGSMAFGATLLDEKSLVLDAYAPAFEGLTMEYGTLDPAFAANIPAEMSFVTHSSNLGGILDVYLDLFVTMMEASPEQNQRLNRAQINGLVQAALGVDIDSGILPWLGSDFALMADFDMSQLLDMVEAGNMDEITIDPHFAFVAAADGSEKPSEFVAAVGRLLTNQTANMPNAPEFTIESNDSGTTLIIEDVAQGSDIDLTIQMTGNADLFVVGDQATVEALLNGEGGFTESAGFVAAQKYILPNAVSIAYAGGEGWGDVITLGAIVGVMMGMPNDDQQTQLMADTLRSMYDIIDTSSISATLNEDGSQTSRLVLTLK